MSPEKILAKAEALKKKTHRLSLSLRLKSVAEARRFLRDLGVVLWSGKAELPNLLDAILGRIANGRERLYGKPVEQCDSWRGQILTDVEFLDCHFFSKMSTAMYQDLWPYATVFARRNRKKAEEETLVSRDAKRILSFLAREGACSTGTLRKALRYNSSAEGRLFRKATLELQNRLILLSRVDQSSEQKPSEIIDFWENRMPKGVRTKADQISEKDARTKLLAATLNVSVLSNEKHIPRWFYWTDGDWKEAVESLIQKKDFMRVEHKNTPWIIPRKVLSLKL